MCAALRDHRETAEWYKEKGEAAGKPAAPHMGQSRRGGRRDRAPAVAEFNGKFMVVNEAGKE